jgi:hypothetical protein
LHGKSKVFFNQNQGKGKGESHRIKAGIHCAAATATPRRWPSHQGSENRTTHGQKPTSTLTGSLSLSLSLSLSHGLASAREDGGENGREKENERKMGGDVHERKEERKEEKGRKKEEWEAVGLEDRKSFLQCGCG